MSLYIHKSHNVSVLLYHIICPAKYRRAVFSDEVGDELKEICIEISKRYEIHFIEIGTDGDHVHFLVQSVPTYSPTKIVRTIKSITGRELFRRLPSVKEVLWGGELWTDGYYIETVGKKGNETVIQKYIQSQGKEAKYIKLHYEQLQLF
ncbi:MAG: IS200/IS605 family transposase [Gammaproteobacteria bacterium]|nr:IS200/IS605 family transposase [Gammaproteobacteria bacterium]